MMDRAIYATITELNLLPVQSRQDRALIKQSKQIKKQQISKISKHKWQRTLVSLVRYCAASIF